MGLSHIINAFRSLNDLWATSTALPQLVWTHTLTLYTETMTRLRPADSDLPQECYEAGEFEYRGTLPWGNDPQAGSRSGLRMSTFYDSKQISLESLTNLDTESNYRDPMDALPPTPQ